MFTESDIDYLANDIYNNGYSIIYYIAHMTELREDYIDELAYKSTPKFRILELKLTGIDNAYWELLNYQNHPELYHTEQEDVRLINQDKYTYYYTVPNKKTNYVKDINPRMPSAIYGKKRILYTNNVIKAEYNDPSLVKPIYTNVLKFNGISNATEILNLFDNGRLDWKYRKLDEPITVDNISFKYVTSDWYILDIENFPRIEKHMINTNKKTAFFINLWEAQSYLIELKA